MVTFQILKNRHPARHGLLPHLLDHGCFSDTSLSRNDYALLFDGFPLDRFITSFALQVMMWNWDGYAMNINNYRVYHDPTTDKLVFLPHGLDQMFSQPTGPIFPRTKGMIARAVLQIPEARQEYVERMSQLLTNVYQVEAITNRVIQQAARIRPVLAERHPQAAAAHPARVNTLCNRIAQRARSIEQQLGVYAAKNSLLREPLGPVK